MKVGTYCVGTKYSDGSGADPWAVGFFAAKIGDRFIVVDEAGKSFRAGGFRRVKALTAGLS